MALQLHPLISPATLAKLPSITEEENVQIGALACSVRILLNSSSGLALKVLDAMKNIYRRAFHEQFADEVKDVWLEHTRNLMLREYFPTVYHPQYFEGKSYAESIRKFLRFADQRFTHIQIRGTDTADDFVVTAIIPGSCMVLLARISDEHAVTPTLDEVELIVANRHANIDYKWPVGIGLAVGMLIVFVLVSFRIDLHDYGVPAILFAGMTIASGIAFAKNHLKDRRFARRHPQLTPVI